MNFRPLPFAALFLCAGCSCPAEAPPTVVNQTRLGGIEPDTVAAWKSRGFEPGWIAESKASHRPVPFIFISNLNEKEVDHLGEVIPAFKFDVTNTAPNLKDLPAIKRPFGLATTGYAPMNALLNEIGGLQNLSVLLVEGFTVTDEGAKGLATLTNLKALRLGPCKVTAAGLKHLAGLKNLRHLNLFNSPVTDEGLRNLATLSLTSLDLGGTDVTDEGLKHLTGHKSLTCLSLTRVPTVTDSGLEKLALLKNLTDLDISWTRATDSGAEKLRERLPGCRVFLKN